MPKSFLDLLKSVEGIDALTGYPHRTLLGFAEISSQSEHLARYLFARSHVKGVVLDIAASSCYGSSILSHSATEYVVCADLDKNVLLYGKKVFISDNMIAVQCDGTHLPFKDNAFDSIISIETIEHLPDPSLFIKELNRTLNRKGNLLLSTPNKNITSPLLFKPLNPYHFNEYELKHIIPIITENNMKLTKVFYQTKSPLYLIFARLLGILPALLFVKSGIGLARFRRLSNFFSKKNDYSNELFDPDPSLYPVVSYQRSLDCLLNYQLIVLAEKNGDKP